jgi:hypothetical protein
MIPPKPSAAIGPARKIVACGRDAGLNARIVWEAPEVFGSATMMGDN